MFFNPYKNLFAKSLVMIAFEISKHRWDDNIKMCLNDMDSEVMGWIQVLQDYNLWQFCGCGNKGRSSTRERWFKKRPGVSCMRSISLPKALCLLFYIYQDRGYNGHLISELQQQWWKATLEKVSQLTYLGSSISYQFCNDVESKLAKLYN